jgi:hypothetical protein
MREWRYGASGPCGKASDPGLNGLPGLLDAGYWTADGRRKYSVHSPQSAVLSTQSAVFRPPSNNIPEFVKFPPFSCFPYSIVLISVFDTRKYEQQQKG